jgi:hypothetical protein
MNARSPAGSGARKFEGAYAIWKRVLPKPVKRWSMVAWYNLVARIDKRGELLFMNHGYAPMCSRAKSIGGTRTRSK